MKRKQTHDEYHVHGRELLKKIKELIAEGNVREITIKNRDGEPIIVLPLTIGVVGAVIAPALAAVGAIAALVTDCTISVERKG
jgi:hypothetical protein